VIRDENGVESFLMVKQWRHGAEQLSVEFPGGVIDKGEDPAQAAARELLGETGYRADELTLGASISPNPAIMDNLCHIFFARNLINTYRLDLDDDEFVNTEAIPVTHVIKEMGRGLYIHALMSAALFFYIQKNGLGGT
jgi:8-oxo-dGTP pyrophosphatase MutT (NUDIX family)